MGEIIEFFVVVVWLFLHDCVYPGYSYFALSFGFQYFDVEKWLIFWSFQIRKETQKLREFEEGLVSQYKFYLENLEQMVKGILNIP